MEGLINDINVPHEFVLQHFIKKTCLYVAMMYYNEVNGNNLLLFSHNIGYYICPSVDECAYFFYNKKTRRFIILTRVSKGTYNTDEGGYEYKDDIKDDIYHITNSINIILARRYNTDLEDIVEHTVLSDFLSLGQNFMNEDREINEQKMLLKLFFEKDFDKDYFFSDGVNKPVIFYKTFRTHKLIMWLVEECKIDDKLVNKMVKKYAKKYNTLYPYYYLNSQYQNEYEKEDCYFVLKDQTITCGKAFLKKEYLTLNEENYNKYIQNRTYVILYNEKLFIKRIQNLWRYNRYLQIILGLKG